MAASYVAHDIQIATDTSTSEAAKTTQHSVDGSGTDRGVIGIFLTSRFATRTLSSATLNSVSATSIFNTGVSVDGGIAATVAIAYWDDTDEPGAGTHDVVATWDGTVRTHLACLVEVQGADQSTMLAGLASNTATDQSPTYNISSTLANQSGKLAITVLAQADASNPGDPSGSVQPSGTTLLEDKGYDNTGNSDDGVLAVAYDASVGSSSEAYQWTADSDVGTIDSIITLVFAVNAASGGGVSKILSPKHNPDNQFMSISATKLGGVLQ